MLQKMKSKHLFCSKQSVFCSEKVLLWISNEKYLVRRTKYIDSLFPQLYDMCFIETALESLSKSCQSDANRSSGFSSQRDNGKVCIKVFIYVRNSSSANRNNFFLLETIKSMHCILLMFAIAICDIFLLKERSKSSGNIIWSLSFSLSLAFLSFRSWSYSSVRRASNITLLQMMIQVLKTFAILSRISAP